MTILSNKTTPFDLPDNVIHEILYRLPTKNVVGISFLCKQWEIILSSLPTLDFDEDDGNDLQKHCKFINVLDRSLSVCQNEKHERELDKFRLHMTNYSCQDASIVSKWLCYSFMRSVKEVDINLEVGKSESPYSFSLSNIANDSRSMMSVNLDAPRLFLCLKRMSFKNLFFDNHALYYLINECPAVESLSLISCSFNDHIYLVDSSMKSLKIQDCDAVSILMSSNLNLESITVVSNTSLRHVELLKCKNLKYINVSGNRQLKRVHVDGCNGVNGTIDAPCLDFFMYKGYLNSRFYLRAPKLRVTVIILWDNWAGETYELKDFLQGFRTSKQVSLHVNDFKTLIFPDEFRRTLSASILPTTEIVSYVASEITATGRDEEFLVESLRWMAPLARNIYQLEYNVELEMYEYPM